MENTPTRAPVLLGKLRAWLRGDRFMRDSQPPTEPVAGPAAVPAPAAGAHAPAKEG
jgi:hypothetical protein